MSHPAELLPGFPGTAPKRCFEGVLRIVAPDETVARVQRIAPALGITRVAHVTGLDTVGIPVVVVCRPNSRSLSVAQGKGYTLAAAVASGLMESVELYHAEHVTLPLKLASYNELRHTHTMIDPTTLPRLAVSSFHPDRKLLWIEGLDLLSGGSAWVPYEMVHTDYALPFPPGSGTFAMSSNGLASGNHGLEALVQGITEVVERDASTLWHGRSEDERASTRIDLGTVDDPLCVAVLERFAAARVAVAVWEMTSDTGIPAFYCAVVDADPDPLRPLYPSGGMGCHPTRQVALLRALLEAAQSRLTMIASSRDDVPREDYELSQHPDVLDQARAEIEDTRAPRSFKEVGSFESDTFADDAGWLLERLRGAGVEQVVVVDLTIHGIGIPVVRVIVPGLEAYFKAPGYAPGPRQPRLVQAAAPVVSGSAGGPGEPR